MKTCDKLYAIVEVDEGGERFFNGLLRPGHYNKSYKLSVFKYLKTAENRLKDIQNEYQGFIDDDRRRDYRVTGELIIKEFTS